MRFYVLTTDDRRNRVLTKSRFKWLYYNVNLDTRIKINEKVVIDWNTVTYGTFGLRSNSNNNNNNHCHGGG